MKKAIKWATLATLAMVLVFLSLSTALAQSDTGVTLQGNEEGVVLKGTTPSERPRYSGYAYIEERYETLGEFDDWSLVDKAGFSEWMEAQGRPQRTVVNGIPGEENRKLEDVIAQARAAVLAKYDVKEEVLDEMFKVQSIFNIIDPDNPLWMISFRVQDGYDVNDLGYYRVDVDDRTGEIEAIYSIADAKG